MFMRRQETHYGNENNKWLVSDETWGAGWERNVKDFFCESTPKEKYLLVIIEHDVVILKKLLIEASLQKKLILNRNIIFGTII